jgi:hypothetical protein
VAYRRVTHGVVAIHRPRLVGVGAFVEFIALADSAEWDEFWMTLAV